jgi:hypothetical protein
VLGFIKHVKNPSAMFPHRQTPRDPIADKKKQPGPAEMEWVDEFPLTPKPTTFPVVDRFE